LKKVQAMWSRRFRPSLAISLVSALALVATAAQAESRDPIGSIVKTATVDRAEHVNLGKAKNGGLVCFYREEGSSHRLDIGIGASGAFIRVESGDGPLAEDEIPRPPLRVFAGKELTRLVDGDLKSTGEYEPMQTYDGAVDYVPNIDTGMSGGFVVVAKGDATAFLDTVARSRREFTVVQSVAAPKNVDVIAIYDFNARPLQALIECAKKKLR
jgi:hypothetical protein